MQEVSPMRPCIHLLFLHKLINIIKLTKTYKPSSLARINASK